MTFFGSSLKLISLLYICINFDILVMKSLQYEFQEIIDKTYTKSFK